MKTTTRLLLASSLVALAFAPAPLTADEATVQKARAFVGPENELAALHSVHFKGTLTVMDKDADGKPLPINVGLEIIFQKPCQQRIVATSPEKIEITALNGYDAWQRIEDPKNPDAWQLTILGSDQIKRLRANTWENLAFYRGLEDIGGKIEDLGPATIDGKATRKLSFVHADNIVFFRYFETETGRLLLTETESGSTIREEGDLRAGKLRFPRKIVTSNKLNDGSTRELTVVFDTVTVNETFPPALFEVPSFAPPK
ncbi:hypothetical protein Ga0100231_008535 [Opitutaceae bacterium TAV4]|uniref:hypothetical protein n=1 Tax=Geminisphaera colitermitum TaxID=1148786 RepID=UPI000158CD14|nr:hypothetical protein [Geminisphaera colitermitum]RRJ94400.1 hypothetical protein Ga0100231_008535 [Opitutaceae bacterium TAV4]RRJ98490.1 hypothetical protein Ga0100230_008820 [Opitutaceae bacterium TAV3]